MSARFNSGAQMWALPPGHVHKHLHRPGLLVIYEVFFHPNVLGFLSNTVVVCFFLFVFFWRAVLTYGSFVGNYLNGCQWNRLSERWLIKSAQWCVTAAS